MEIIDNEHCPEATMQRRNLLSLAAAAAYSVFLLGTAGCSDKAADASRIRVGVTAGPHADIVTKAAEVAKQKGLTVEVVEFTDYISPDRSLADGALDAVVYQHEPFLQNFNKVNKTDLRVVGKAVVQPMGCYSKTIKSVAEIPEGSVVAIPNDPTNGGRGLLLLEAQGLIKLKADRKDDAVPADVVENPKNLKILEMEAAQLPRSLDDTAVAVIPMNYVISSGLSPEKEGFAFESLDAAYALIIIAARPDNAESNAVKTFVESYRSPETKRYVEETFRGTIRPTW